MIIGGLVGHTLCTGFAAVSGYFVAKKVSLRTGISETFNYINLTFLNVSLSNSNNFKYK